MGKSACIVTGGKLSLEFLKQHMGQKKYDFSFAVDGALKTLHEAGMMPDYIVGDFDTVEEAILSRYPEEIILRHCPEKDQTDTELAVEAALSRGCTEISFLGATGRRLDHSLANLFLLQKLLKEGVSGFLYDEYNKLYLKNRSFTLCKAQTYGRYVSLLPLTDSVEGVTLAGFKYPTRNLTFYREQTLGVSNEIVQEEATVEFSDGIFIVVESRDERKE